MSTHPRLMHSGEQLGQITCPTGPAAPAGQPDAAVWRGGDYTLAGGFWGQALDRPPFQIYLPLLVRNA